MYDRTAAPIACRSIYLVSCVANKRPFRCVARDLYVSSWFKKARMYVERTGSPWFILSALHGLVDPDTQTDPYDTTLLGHGMAARRQWASRVQKDLAPHAALADTIVIFAGKRYREFLVPGLRAMGLRIDVPLARLGIGEQLRWFSEHGGRI